MGSCVLRDATVPFRRLGSSLAQVVAPSRPTGAASSSMATSSTYASRRCATSTCRLATVALARRSFDIGRLAGSLAVVGPAVSSPSPCASLMFTSSTATSAFRRPGSGRSAPHFVYACVGASLVSAVAEASSFLARIMARSNGSAALAASNGVLASAEPSSAARNTPTRPSTSTTASVVASPFTPGTSLGSAAIGFSPRHTGVSNYHGSATVPNAATTCPSSEAPWSSCSTYAVAATCSGRPTSVGTSTPSYANASSDVRLRRTRARPTSCAPAATLPAVDSPVRRTSRPVHT